MSAVRMAAAMLLGGALIACQPVEVEEPEPIPSVASQNAATSLVSAFAVACLAGLDDLAGQQARLDAAGFDTNAVGERTRPGIVYRPEPGSGGQFCAGVGPGTDPVALITAASAEARLRGLTLGETVREGARRTVPLTAPQGQFRLEAEPTADGLTRISVVRS